MPNKNNHNTSSRESGQALVFVLLSLSVVLTLVLFVISRSITDVKTSTEQADSIRAFSAAEAGVEKAIITGAGSDGSVSIGDASYTVDVRQTGSSTFNYPLPMQSGETMTLWFVSHKEDGTLTCDPAYPPCYTRNTLTVCWGNPGASSNVPTTPAIEVSVYYDTNPSEIFATPPTYTGVEIARATYDPYAARTLSNQFSAATIGNCDIDGVIYPFRSTIAFSDMGGTGVNNDGLIFAKIRMMYNTDQGHTIGFRVPSGTLPVQGLEVTSTGASVISESPETSPSYRKIQYFKSWDEFPLSGLAIFTPSGITK